MNFQISVFPYVFHQFNLGGCAFLFMKLHVFLDALFTQRPHKRVIKEH